MRSKRWILLTVILASLMVTQAAWAQKSLFVMIPHTEGQAEYTWFSTILEKFKAEHPDVEIRFEHMIGTALPPRLTAYLLSGQVPDVVWIMQRDLGALIRSDIIRDLNPYIDADDTISREEYVPAFMEYWSRDGKQLAMPINPDTAVVFYNLDTFGNAGLPPLRETWPAGDWTWDDFRSVAQRLRVTLGADDVPQIYPYESSITWEPTWAGPIFTNGGSIYDLATGTSGLREPEAYNALQWLADLKRDGLMQSSPYASVNHAQGAMFGGPAGMSAQIADSGARYAAFPQPRADMNSTPAHLMLGPGLMMFEQSSNSDLGWALIRELVSHESMELLAQLTGRLPARTSTFPDWTANFDAKVLDGRYFIEAVNTGRGMPYNSRWTDMNAALRQGVVRLWSGVEPAQIIFEEVARQLEAMGGQ